MLTTPRWHPTSLQGTCLRRTLTSDTDIDALKPHVGFVLGSGNSCHDAILRCRARGLVMRVLVGVALT
jgi:hypothetical protein